MRWVIKVLAGSFVLLVVVLLIEVLLARRAPRLEGWNRAQLDGTFGDGSADPIHVVWIGDSTGAGVGTTSPDRALPRLVASGLSRPIRLTVLARSGSRASDAVDEQLGQLRKLEPDWVIIAIGNNDVTHLTSRPTFERELTRLLDGVAAVKPERIAMLGVAEFAGTPVLAQPLRMLTGLRSDQMDEVAREVANAHDALYVDIKGKTAAAFVGDPETFHARDGFHPSDDGYAAWARVTLDAIAAARW